MKKIKVYVVVCSYLVIGQEVRNIELNKMLELLYIQKTQTYYDVNYNVEDVVKYHIYNKHPVIYRVGMKSIDFTEELPFGYSFNRNEVEQTVEYMYRIKQMIFSRITDSEFNKIKGGKPWKEYTI